MATLRRRGAPIARPSTPWAGVAAAAGFLVIAAFELALALGAPLGRAAWGGANAELPIGLRIASGFAVAFWTLAAAIVLGRAGFPMPLPCSLVRWGTRILVGLNLLAALLNFASSSPWERFLWGPVALVEAGLCLIVARSGSPPVERWMYRSGRPNWLAAILNRWWAMVWSAGIGSSRWVALEVRGRRSGNLISFPVVVADYQGERYLVAMLGEGTNWVANVRAAGGRASLVHGRREAVKLEEVDVPARAPILRQYLQVAPGGRPHIPVDRRAPLADFERVAARYPVFRIRGDSA
jgi:hypothetical protein